MTSLEWLKMLGAKVPARPRVPESLRGWNIKLGQFFRYYLPLPALITDCPTGRVAYIFHRGLVKTPDTPSTVRGKVYHALLRPAYRESREGKVTDAMRYVEQLVERESVDPSLLPERWKIEYFYTRLREAFDLLPPDTEVYVEKELDGSFLGVSGLRPDLVVQPPPLPVELKTNFYRRRLTEYVLQLTAYTLALENSLEAPVDYGGVIEATPRDVRAFLLGIDALCRRKLLSLISQKLAVCRSLEPEDPGSPDPVYCGRCRYRPVCERDRQ